jgi:hypothetical protein
VLKAMAKPPNERYQTAAEMQADIQRAASGMQIMMGAALSAVSPYQQTGYGDYDYPGRGRRGGRGGRPVRARRRQSQGEPDDPVSIAVRAAVKPGLLTFNPPAEMTQGRKERVEVGIARSRELRDALTSGLRGRGSPELQQIDTSPFMGVELRGASFEVTSLSPLEQLVAPIARWEFDVRPNRAGQQTLTLCVAMRVDSPMITGGRIAVPVLERQIRIHVDVVFGVRRFVTQNWQWIIATGVGLGGALAAWLTLFH